MVREKGIRKEKDEITKKRHFVENKTDYAACLKNTVNFLVASIYKIYF
jgi:hypothetical protein